MLAKKNPATLQPVGPEDNSVFGRTLNRAAGYSPNSTWLVTSRHDATRSTRRTCRAVLFDKLDTEPKCMGSTRLTCRVVSRRDVTSQVESGLKVDRLVTDPHVVTRRHSIPAKQVSNNENETRTRLRLTTPADSAIVPYERL